MLNEAAISKNKLGIYFYIILIIQNFQFKLYLSDVKIKASTQGKSLRIRLKVKKIRQFN